MKHWIHFIGKNYYTISKFKAEAQRIGVSRAIAPQVLKKMYFGDIVLLAQKDGTSTKIFGWFKLTQITGLSDIVVSKIREAGCVTKLDSLVPMHIERGCGRYDITAQFTITSPDEIMKIIRQTDDKQLGRVMIGGTYHDLSPLGIDEEYLLSEIPFRMGFREIDFSALLHQYMEKMNPNSNRHVKLKGQFYVTTDTRLHPISTWDKADTKLLVIKNYQLN